jgi:branched-chain amino acid transport system ATP-binding protein
MRLLELNNLDAGYGDARALSKISLSIEPGDVLALVGANGAGKSTLLRLIAGSHMPWGGSITFKGSDITAMPDFERTRLGIALVPEGRRLFASLSVRENLMIGAASKRTGMWNIDSVLDALPMVRPLLERNASRLSGGQQQAVAIGRALMSNPDLLLLDEVSLGLAPIIVDELYESFARVKHTGIGLILVEQDLSRTLRVSSRIVCLLEGHQVLEGNPESLSREQITAAYFGNSVNGFANDEGRSKGMHK